MLHGPHSWLLQTVWLRRSHTGRPRAGCGIPVLLETAPQALQKVSHTQSGNSQVKVQLAKGSISQGSDLVTCPPIMAETLEAHETDTAKRRISRFPAAFTGLALSTLPCGLGVTCSLCKNQEHPCISDTPVCTDGQALLRVPTRKGKGEPYPERPGGSGSPALLPCAERAGPDPAAPTPPPRNTQPPLPRSLGPGRRRQKEACGQRLPGRSPGVTVGFDGSKSRERERESSRPRPRSRSRWRWGLPRALLLP